MEITDTKIKKDVGSFFIKIKNEENDIYELSEMIANNLFLPRKAHTSYLGRIEYYAIIPTILKKEFIVKIEGIKPLLKIYFRYNKREIYSDGYGDYLDIKMSIGKQKEIIEIDSNCDPFFNERTDDYAYKISNVIEDIIKKHIEKYEFVSLKDLKNIFEKLAKEYNIDYKKDFALTTNSVYYYIGKYKIRISDHDRLPTTEPTANIYRLIKAQEREESDYDFVEGEYANGKEGVKKQMIEMFKNILIFGQL